MLMKRKLNISIFTAFAAALLLLATDVFAGNYGKKQYGIADTAGPAHSPVRNFDPVKAAIGDTLS